MNTLLTEEIIDKYDSRWSNDKYATFFIMEYPDVECAMLDTSGVEEAGLFRYIVSKTILGVEEVHGNSKGIDCIRICPF